MNQFEEKIKKERKQAFKRRLISSGLGIILIIVLSFFILVSRGIDIKISPEEAINNSKIQITEGYGLVFGKKVYSITSNITLIVRSEGFKIYKNRFNLNLISESIEILLEELPGNLSIEIFPKHSDHKILLNNKNLKNKDLILIENLVGIYQLSITNPYFISYDSEIIISPGESKKLKINLDKMNILTNFNTRPLNAKIFINDLYEGVTPLKKNMKSGQYKLKIEKNGYTSLTKDLNLYAEKETIDFDYELKLVPGKLVINSKPSNSDIYIDNTFIGKGNTISILSHGEHLINILQDGFYPINENIFVTTNKEIIKNYNLKEMLGSVLFSSSPSSEIFIDGVSYGYTPKRIVLRSIQKKVEFKKENYRTFVSSIISDSKIEKKVSTVLLTETQARLKEAKKIIQTSLGGKLKLFVPNKLTLGAPRSDPGQRANEVIRNVSLTRPFYIGINLITNQEFQLFRNNNVKDNNPITSINWYDAVRFCNWLSKKDGFEEVYLFRNKKYIGINKSANGYRLPTESEWAWVARYANKDSKNINRFAWGNNSKVKKGFGNLAGEEVKNLNDDFIKNYTDRFKKLSPVGSFKPSKSGIYDLTGNAHEWTHDFYELLSFDVSKGINELDRIGPNNGSGHVIRGSSWRSSSLTELRLTFRDKAINGEDDISFRVARWIGE